MNLFYKTVVGDNPGRMHEVLNLALERSDIVITGGGLGPTQDDLTREAIAEATGRDLVVHPDLIEQIESRFRRRGHDNDRQQRATGEDPRGRDAGEQPERDGTVLRGGGPPRGVVFALPGVPFELKWLFDNEVAPYLRRRFGLTGTIVYRVLKVAEIGESNVDDRIGHLIAELSNPTVGVLAHPGQVDIRIAAKASDADEAMKADRAGRGGGAEAAREARLRGRRRNDRARRSERCCERVAGPSRSFEDATGGMLAGRLYQSAPGPVRLGGERQRRANYRPTRRERTGRLSSPDARRTVQKSLRASLAAAIRSQGGSDLGIALHAVLDPTERAENLGRGQTYVAVTDGGWIPGTHLPVRAGGAGPTRPG